MANSTSSGTIVEKVTSLRSRASSEERSGNTAPENDSTILHADTKKTSSTSTSTDDDLSNKTLEAAAVSGDSYARMINPWLKAKTIGYRTRNEARGYYVIKIFYNVSERLARNAETKIKFSDTLQIHWTKSGCRRL